MINSVTITLHLFIIIIMIMSGYIIFREKQIPYFSPRTISIIIGILVVLLVIDDIYTLTQKKVEDNGVGIATERKLVSIGWVR